MSKFIATHQKKTFVKTISSQAGLTLVDSMIALLLFSVGILGTLSMLTVSIYMNAQSRIQTGGLAAASQYLEFMLSLPFNDPLLQDSDDGFSPDTPDHGPFSIAATHSSVEWEVDDQFPLRDSKRVAITIRFAGRKGPRKVFRYEFIKARGFVQW